MKDSNKWWAVLFIAVVCVFLGVHATLDLAELRGSIDERLGSIDESLAEMNQTLAERARTTPSLGLNQVDDASSLRPVDPGAAGLDQREPASSQELDTVQQYSNDEREGTLLPLPSDGFIDHSEQVIRDLGNMDARIEEFRTSMSEQERSILEDMKEQAFHAAVGGTELVQSLSEEELATLKTQLLDDPQMAAYFIVVEDKILRQMVIDKALNGVASPFSIEAVQQK